YGRPVFEWTGRKFLQGQAVAYGLGGLRTPDEDAQHKFSRREPVKHLGEIPGQGHIRLTEEPRDEIRSELRLEIEKADAAADRTADLRVHTFDLSAAF